MKRSKTILFFSRFLYIKKASIFLGAMLIIGLLGQLSAFSQASQPQGSPADTSKSKDTLYVPTPPISLVGTVDRLLPAARILTDTAISFTDYKYLGDLIATFPGVYMRDLGTPGQLHGLTIDGVDGRAIAVMSDGVLLNDPLNGVFDLNLYQTEQIQRVEMIPETRAFLYGLNSTGGAVNLVRKNYNAVKPISRIRFDQSAYGYTMFDGLVSQDIRRNLNVTLGLEHPGFGPWFKNNTYDAWNGRARIRYNVSENLDVFVSDDYAQTHQGLNGGIDTSTDIANRYSPSLAGLLTENGYEKVTRNEMQAGAAARLLPDSTDVSTLTVFHTTNLREFRIEDPTKYVDSMYQPYRQDTRSQWFGVRATQHLSLPDNILDIGAEVQSRGVLASSIMQQHLATYMSIWGKDEISLVPDVTLAGYARIDKHEDVHHLSLGADGSYQMAYGVEVFGGLSHSYRDASLEENYWQDSTVSSTNPMSYNVETHNLIEIGLGIRNDVIEARVKAFKRMIDNPITTLATTVFNPYPKVVFDIAGKGKLDIQGIDINARLRFGSIIAEGMLQYIQMKLGGELLSELPEVTGSGGVYFWDTLYHSHLNLKTGVRGRFITAHDGMEYNQQAQMFLPATLRSVRAVGTADFVLMAHFGDAELHLIWENLLNLHYITVPFYPMPDRQMRFGLNWSFLN